MTTAVRGLRHGWTRTDAAALALACAVVALAGSREARADERSDIASARAAAEARFAGKQKACRERFVVTSCIDDARKERRTALDALRTRQLALDEQRRHERADQRRKDLAEKAEEDARREREQRAKAAAAPASGGASAPAAASAVKPRSGAKGEPYTPRTPKPPEPAASRAAREQTSRKAFEQRRQDADTHREQSLDATLRRLSAKPPSSSLPLPPAASGAAPAARPASR